MITIKTAEDIEKLREGGRRHAEMLRKLAAMTEPGVSTEELNAAALKMIEDGGDAAAFLNYRPRGVKRPYPAALCVSINDIIVHGIPNVNPRVLQEGDIVTLDLGLTHQGLITDAAVTLGVGKIDDDSRRLIHATREALERGIKAVAPGNHIGDIGAALEIFAQEEGYAITEDLAGHGVGYSVHEDPFVPNTGVAGQGPALKPGMVLAIEPMLTLGGGRVVFEGDEYTVRTKDGSRAAHFEHTVLVTEDGVEVLTR
ncbi:MAG TPA: type I methionyl aminopeptidase [Candidatus Paceibacterota bacterium]|nr:type I methionyl aminopeptidase [Candidatus Paceibacterota bacterium]